MPYGRKVKAAGVGGLVPECGAQNHGFKLQRGRLQMNVIKNSVSKNSSAMELILEKS